MVTYGCDITGMANQHLETARRCLSHAVVPEGGWKSLELVLYVTDGARGTLDPPLYMWAKSTTVVRYETFLAGIYFWKISGRNFGRRFMICHKSQIDP